MSSPLISVGIPFYNSQGVLLNSIKSIFAQTFQDWELILVDDGSTDKSLDIAYSINDPRIRVLPSDGKNRRLAFRLNQIAQASRGTYLARMDADDLCHPERFAKQLDFFKAHPEVDIVGSSSCILDARGRPSKKLIVAKTHEDIFENKFKKGVSVVHPSLMAKTEWWRRWPYDTNKLRTQDYELWLRSCEDNIFANITAILYFTNEFLSFAIRKYIYSKFLTAKIIWKYASQEVNRFQAAYFTGKQYFDIAGYLWVRGLGMHSKLISRRYRSLSSQEYSDLSATLDVIKNTKVPIFF